MVNGNNKPAFDEDQSCLTPPTRRSRFDGGRRPVPTTISEQSSPSFRIPTCTDNHIGAVYALIPIPFTLPPTPDNSLATSDSTPTPLLLDRRHRGMKPILGSHRFFPVDTICFSSSRSCSVDGDTDNQIGCLPNKSTSNHTGCSLPAGLHPSSCDSNSSGRQPHRLNRFRTISIRFLSLPIALPSPPATACTTEAGPRFTVSQLVATRPAAPHQPISRTDRIRCAGGQRAPSRSSSPATTRSLPPTAFTSFSASHISTSAYTLSPLFFYWSHAFYRRSRSSPGIRVALSVPSRGLSTNEQYWPSFRFPTSSRHTHPLSSNRCSRSHPTPDPDNSMFSELFSWTCGNKLFILGNSCAQRRLIDAVNFVFVVISVLGCLISYFRREDHHGRRNRNWDSFITSLLCAVLSISCFSLSFWALIGGSSNIFQLKWLVCFVRGIIWISLAFILYIYQAMFLHHKVMTTLIDLYCKCGFLDVARKLLDDMADRDLVSWNVMMCGFVENFRNLDALSLFHRMMSDGLRPNGVTLVILLSACKEIEGIKMGPEIHCNCLRNGLFSEVNVGTSLADFYSKFDAMASRSVFNLMEVRNKISRNIIIDAYVMKTGYDKEPSMEHALLNMYVDSNSISCACTLFNKMERPEVISWNTLIKTWIDNGNTYQAWKLFDKMKRVDEKALNFYHVMIQQGLMPSHFTFASALCACASLMDLVNGKICDGLIARVITDEDMAPTFFSKESGTFIEENKLRVVLVSPPDSPFLQPFNGTSKQEAADESPKLKPASVAKESPVVKESSSLKDEFSDDKNLNPSHAKEVENLKSKINTLQSKLSEADKMITILKKDKLKLYELLVGSTQGSLQDWSVDWKRHIGLVMWYQLPHDTPLPVLINIYEQFLSEERATYPVPVYVDEGPIIDRVEWSATLRARILARRQHLVFDPGGATSIVSSSESSFSCVREVFKSYGYLLPAIIASILLATGPKAFLMALALPLGQSAISLAIDKLWGGEQDEPRTSPRIRRKPFSTASTDFRKQEQDDDNSVENKRRAVYQSWVATENSSDDDKCKDSERPSFGGLDELDQQRRQVRWRPPKPYSSSKSAQVKMGKLSKKGRYKDAPLFLRLLIAVFPFFGIMD